MYVCFRLLWKKLFISLRNYKYWRFIFAEESRNTSKNVETSWLFQRRIGKICLIAVVLNKSLKLIVFLIIILKCMEDGKFLLQWSLYNEDTHRDLPSVRSIEVTT